MLTGEIRNQIDSIWLNFAAGGLANPLAVIEQITYLFFMKRLDDIQELEERKALSLGGPVKRIIPTGADSKGRDNKLLRWKEFKNLCTLNCYWI